MTKSAVSDKAKTTKATTKKAPATKNPAAKKATSRKRTGPSRRAQQRLIALRLGHENKGMIPIASLREACIKAGIDKLGGNWGANFTQDMKKDATLFQLVEKDGKKVGWKLTGDGKKVAKKAVAAN